MGKAEVAIIGVGQVPTGIFPDRTEYEIAYRASQMAIQDAGIDKNLIGGSVGFAHIMGAEYNTEVFFGRLPEAMGLKGCKMACAAISGGASTFSTMQTATQMLLSGETDYVLVTHTQRFSQFPANEQAKYFSIAGSDLEFEVPYGITYNALAAMVTQGYMHETGTTIEQIASVVVSHRKWGALQKNGMFYGKEVSQEQVLNSKMISYPLTSRMCNVLADGGAAYVLTTAENAGKVCSNPVYILSHASGYSHRQITKAKVRNLGKWGEEWYKPICDLAYERAGVGPEDIDLFEQYGAYPVVDLMIMDAMIGEPGTSGRLFESGETWPGGKYQSTTTGEATGFGHLGSGVGMAALIDGVLQLQGRAGEAQATGNPRFLIKNSAGGAFMDMHFSIMSNQDV